MLAELLVNSISEPWDVSLVRSSIGFERCYNTTMSMKKTALLVALLLAVLAAVILQRFVRSPSESGSAATLAGKVSLQVRLQSGVELTRLYQLERALEEFEACLRLAPDNARALFHRGRIRVALGRWEEAQADLASALRLSPDDARIHRYLFDLYRGNPEGHNSAEQRKHYTALKRISRGLIGLDLQVWDAIYAKGIDDTYRLLAHRLRGRRDSLPEPIRELYDALFPNGNEDPGVQGIPGFLAFQRIFERCPGLVALRRSLALELCNPSRLGLPQPSGGRAPGSWVPLELSEQILEDLLDFSVLYKPDSMDMYYILAVLQMRMGDYTEAVSRLRFLLEVPGASEAFVDQTKFRLALSHYKLGQTDESKRLLRELVNRDGHRQLARWILHLLGDLKLPVRRGRIPANFADGLRFREAAEALGVAKKDAGGSSSWGDYDGDGDLDLFVSGCDTFSILYRNDGGRFVDASAQAGLRDVNSGFSNLFVDYDGDGDLDLFIGRDGWAGPMRNSLYQNRGNGTFLDVTDASGLGRGPHGSSFTSTWADFDRDGHLDLLVANGICGDGTTNRLWRSEGDGTFTDATSKAGLQERPGTRSIGCAVGDYDLDGWPDIFISGVAPTPNRLYRNQGDGTFMDVARTAGVDGAGEMAMGFMAFVDDLNGDTLPDLFMTKWEEDFSLVLSGWLEDYRPTPAGLRTSPRLYINRGDGTFEDVSEAAGFLYPFGAMGGGLADLDNNGTLDIYLGTGGPALERLEPDAVYLNLGNERFLEVGDQLGMNHTGKGHGVSFADYDRDGDLDVYVPFGAAFHGDQWENRFYINMAGNRFHWLQVALEGTRSNRMAVGARVTVEAGGLVIERQKKCGVGFGAGDSPYLHFGLGERSRVDSLVVRWPSGSENSFRDVPADRFLRIVEGKDSYEVETR